MIESRIKEIGLFKVARYLGVTPQRLSNWIRRKSYPASHLKKLSEILKIEPDMLLEEIEKIKVKNV